MHEILHGDRIRSIGRARLDKNFVLLSLQLFSLLWTGLTRLGLDENHGAKVQKSRHTFRKVAKFTANSRCQFTVIYSVEKRLIDKHFLFFA